MNSENATVGSLLARLVSPLYFVEATRESGYKGTASAVAELVDNSLQAKAKQVHIYFEEQEDGDIWAYTLDDGIGMDAAAMAIAPQFGGSSRFNDRSGIGRFGMGLPNASVSQCRRFEIYSRCKGGPLLYCYLDLDHIARTVDIEEGFLAPIEVQRWPLPEELQQYVPATGTLVIWKKCERLNPKGLDGIKKKLPGQLGQVFRNFIYPMEDGKPTRIISVNGIDVKPFDPLYLDPRAEWSGAEERGASHIEVPIPGKKGEVGRITVRYSMLPVEEWQVLSTREKGLRRFTNNRGFSVVRAGREIEVTDKYFLKGRHEGDEGRISNNDAWWACEISFDPTLDEVFGVTHTKQEIRPNLQALQKLREEVTATVTTLRAEYDTRRVKKTPGKADPAEDMASRRDQYLPPPPAITQDPEEYQQVLDDYLEHHVREDETLENAQRRVESLLFTIELESAKEGPFYRTTYLGQNTIVYVNTDHPFYTELYANLDDNPDAQSAVKMLLFALSRGERAAGSEGRSWYIGQRNIWSGALRAYLGK